MPKKKRLTRPSGEPRPSGHAAAAATHSPTSSRRSTVWREGVLRAALAIAAPALFLGVIELGLRLTGYGYDTSYWLDAGDGKSERSNPRFSWRFLGPELAREPLPAVVARHRPAGTYRIVVFGSSAAQGFPDPMFSFSRLLEAMLNDRDSDARFEVINTGMTAINSHAVLPIVRDSRRLSADLFVVYMGNNEVVGPFGPGTVFAGYSPSLRLIRGGLALRTSRLGQLLSDLGPRRGRRKSSESWGGMEMFAARQVAADDPRLFAAYASFRANLEDICDEARAAGVKIILSTVLTNLEDLPPFASVHKHGLTAQQQSEWDEAFADGRALAQAGKHEQAMERYQTALAIDDAHAELHFRIGRCLLALQHLEPARRHLVLARDLDALRFRADSRINDIIRDVARSRSVSLVDVEELVRGPNHTVIPGDELLYEHVHPTFEGNYAIAAGLFGEIGRLLPAAFRGKGDVSPPPIERCAELILFTRLARLSDTRQIRQVTRRPPFGKETDDALSARCHRLETQLAPEGGGQPFEAYRRWIERRPRDLLAGRVLASMLKMTGQLDQSIGQYQRVLERYPDSALIRTELGQTLFAAQRVQEALDQGQRVLRLNPFAENAWTLVGLSLAKLGDADRAERALRKAVALQPQSAEAQAALAQSLVGWGRPGDAIPRFLAALERDPEMAPFHFGLGMAYLRIGDPERALESLERAADIAPDDASFHLQLAQAAYLAKRLDVAREHYRRAAAIDARVVERDPDLRRALWGSDGID